MAADWLDSAPGATSMQEEPPEGWLLEERADGSLSMRRGSSLWGETWTLAPDFLQIESTIVGVRRKAKYQGAELEIQKGGGGRSVSDFTLFAVKGEHKTALAADSHEDEVRRLAVFVAGRTGWPLKTAFYG